MPPSSPLAPTALKTVIFCCSAISYDTLVTQQNLERFSMFTLPYLRGRIPSPPPPPPPGNFLNTELQRRRCLQGDPRFLMPMREVKSQVVTWLRRRRILDFDVLPKREDCTWVIWRNESKKKVSLTISNI